MKATTHLPRTKMNKTEQAWADRLELARLAGEVIDYRFEGMKIRLADGTFYTPDFVVILKDRTIRFDEVKGFMREAARIRLNVAAELYPWLRFMLVRKAKGGFETEIV